MKKITGLGLMSGTSLDGLDICKSTFYNEDNQRFSYEMEKCDFFPYPDDLITKINSCTNLNFIEVQKISLELSKFWTQCIQKTDLNNISYIANHGQTIYHQPKEGLSLQLADNSYMNTKLNIPIIGDFRSGDLHLNGQGAPLVPVGEEFLFPEYQAFINLGGFANISFKDDNGYQAFDLGPCNIINNILCQQIHLKYDKGGQIAKEHQSDIQANEIAQYSQLLKSCVSDKKALSLEDLTPYLNSLITLECKKAIALNTFVTGTYLAEQINKLNLPPSTILCTGGGVYNDFLTTLLKKEQNHSFAIPSSEIIDFKEALIFGFIGALKMWNLPFIHPNYTGSIKSHHACSIFTH